MRPSSRQALMGCALAAMALAGCGGSSEAGGAGGRMRAALVAYLRQVEPIRLAVNRLLEDADPILSGYRSGRLSATSAARRMGALEERFAGYTVDVVAIAPGSGELASLHAGYAHTYILEDAYLSALAAALQTRELAGLPQTQAAQRAAIVEWRTRLAVLAGRAGVTLPADLQLAGRGEIAPSPAGS